MDGYRQSASDWNASTIPQHKVELTMPLKIILGSLGLESFEDQLVHLGIRNLEDMSLLRHEDVTGMSLITFRKMILKCNVGDMDSDDEQQSQSVGMKSEAKDASNTIPQF